jgi:hypothetical protein
MQSGSAWSPLYGNQQHPGQPDDAYGPGSEQYLGLNLWGPAGGWNDEGYVPLIVGYVVEYESKGVPESGSILGPACLFLLGLFLKRRSLAGR